MCESSQTRPNLAPGERKPHPMTSEGCHMRLNTTAAALKLPCTEDKAHAQRTTQYVAEVGSAMQMLQDGQAQR